MGVRTSKSIPLSSNFNISDWINENYATEETGILEYGRMRTLKNRNTEELIDKYENVFLSSHDYHDYIKSYEWRINENFIVRAYHLVTKNSNRYCSNTYHVDVYVEHPKNRLSDFGDIPFPDTLYCLKAILTGYAKLYNNVGPFPIKEEQICIDERGHVRVWLNKDLSKNYPEDWEIEPKMRSEGEEEEEMVYQIVSVIANNSDPEIEPNPSFITFFNKQRQTRTMGFDETLLLVEEYSDLNNTAIPDYFTSVLEVYENQDGLYEVQGGNTNDSFHNYEIGLGDMSQRDIKRQNLSLSGSQVEKITKRENPSRDSKVERESHRLFNDHNNSMSSSNKNEGEAYRLSNLSHLDDKGKVEIYEDGNQNNFQNNGLNSSYRASEHKGNFSQLSQQSNNKSETPIWLSFQPQQPYIPSSQGIMSMNLNQPQPHGYQKDFVIPNVRTVSMNKNGIVSRGPSRSIEQGSIRDSGKNYENNRSISERAEENNVSVSREREEYEEMASLKFERQLEEEIRRSTTEQENREMRSQRSVASSGRMSQNSNKFQEDQNRSHNQYFKENQKHLIEISNQPNTAQFIGSSSRGSVSQHWNQNPIGNIARNSHNLLHGASSLEIPRQSYQSFFPIPSNPIQSQFSIQPNFTKKHSPEHISHTYPSEYKDKIIGKDLVSATYCTLDEEIALDPEIANDLLYFE